MAVFSCKHVAPTKSFVIKIEAASKEEAAQEFHFNNLSGSTLKCSDGSMAYYSIIDVDGDQFISRIFHRSIGRRGGIRIVAERTIQDVAKELGVDVGKLSEDGWLFEEDTWRH